MRWGWMMGLVLNEVPRLTWSDIKTFEQISFLCKLRRKRGLLPFCIPGRAYLARKTGYSIRTVSRATSRLVSAGLLQKRQRRPTRGQWQSNLYRPVSQRFWKLSAALGQLFSIKAVEPAYGGPHLAYKHKKENNKNLRIQKNEAPLYPEKPISTQIMDKLPLLTTWLNRNGP